jgi:PAS domain S-box-containing protein
MAWRSSPEATVHARRWDRIGKPIFWLVVCIAIVYAVTAALYVAVPVHHRPVTAALAFLSLLLIVSSFWGFRYALFVSFLTVLGFTWLLPPVGRFWLSDPGDALKLAAFLVIGITASRFSDRARKEALNAKRAEDAARGSEKELRDLIESVPAMVFVALAGPSNAFASQRWREYTGLSSKDTAGSGWQDVVHPEDLERHMGKWRVCSATGEPFEDEARFRRAADGEYRWFLVRAVPLCDEKGKVLKWYGVLTDIEDRKQAEQARQELEEQLRAAFESNPTMYFIIDAGGKIASVNTFGAEQLGYSVSELVGQPVLNIFYEPDRDAIQNHAKECFEQPGRTIRWEARKIRKDGTMLWVRETGNAVVLKKRPVLLVVCENITEQKRAEEAARRSERELRDIVETIPAMAFSIRPDGSSEFVNQRVLDYTGLTAENISAPGWQSTVHPDDLDRHMNKWHSSMATGALFENEVRHRSASGEYRWFLVRAVPLRDERGIVLKWYGSLTDIEDRKRAEALLTGEKRILEMVAKGDPLAPILDNLCRLVEEQASKVLTSILLVDGNRLRHGGAPSLPKAYTDAIDGAVIGPSVGSCGTAAYRGQQVIVEDIATDPLWADYRAAALPHSLRACWSTPIFSSQGKVIATFAMYYREPRSPSVRDQEVIEQITHLAGVAIERKQTQEALRRSEAYLAEAQRLSKIGSWAFSPVTKKTHYWSDEMFRIWGFDPQEGPPELRTVWQRIHPEDIEGMRDSIERGFEGQLTADVVADHRIVLPDGTLKYIHGISHPVFDESGQVVEYVGTAVDVTERKQVEEALRRSEAYLAEAQRLTHTGSWAWDPHGDKMLYCSEELSRIYDLDPQERIPPVEVFEQRVHPEDRDRWKAEEIKGVLDKKEHTIPYRILLPDGTIKYALSIRHPVLDKAGEVVEMIGTTVDVTERKRAEEALQRSESYLAEAQRLTHTGSWARNMLTGETSHSSEEHTRLFGFDPELGIPSFEEFSQHIHPEDRAKVAETFDRAVRERIDFEVDLRTVMPDDTIKCLHGVGHPVFGAAGDLIEYVGTVVDVSERKRAEAERERLRQLEADLAHTNRVSMMGELSASIAHEIKQPITAAATNAKTSLRWLQREHPDIGEAREALSRIVKDVNRAAEIIDRNRALYRRGSQEREMIDLNELIREMIALLHDAASRQSIAIRAEVDRTLPPITADRVQMQQVLMNLMLNGIESMKDTGGELKIGLKKTEDGQMQLSVSDSGIGLPAENAERIFDAFFSTKDQGTGMGLSISRRIVESHGGRLWATANSGRGATFHFTVPIEVKAIETPLERTGS